MTLDQIEEVEDTTQEMITEQIKQGYTSGYLTQNDYRVYWEIKINIFE